VSHGWEEKQERGMRRTLRKMATSREVRIAKPRRQPMKWT